MKLPRVQRRDFVPSLCAACNDRMLPAQASSFPAATCSVNLGKMQKGMLSGQLAKASWYGFQSSLLKHNWGLEEMVDARVGDHTPGTPHTDASCRSALQRASSPCMARRPDKGGLIPALQSGVACSKSIRPARTSAGRGNRLCTMLPVRTTAPHVMVGH